MAEASDLCVRTLLRNCQASRAVAPLVLAASKDKNAKIRSCCMAYVALILESWDASVVGAVQLAQRDSSCVL